MLGQDSSAASSENFTFTTGHHAAANGVCEIYFGTGVSRLFRAHIFHGLAELLRYVAPELGQLV